MNEGISRRAFLRGLTAGCIASAVPCGAFAEESMEAKRLNILFITADDMNHDSTGVTGCKIPNITPHIDRLASEGVLFTNAHVSIAVCQPSRSALMTGRYPVRNGARGFEPIDTSVPTLQEQLRKAGYLNGIMAKNNHLAPREKFCWDYYITPDELGKGRAPELYYKHAKEFFDQAKSAGKPFFLMANSCDPHRPFAGSKQEMNQYSAHTPVSRTIKPEEVEVPGFLPDIPDVRKEVAEYFTSVHRCDETVGEVLRALKDAGCEQDTLVMFLSDNGMSFPFSKTNCYLFSTKTPWIARWPGKTRPGSRCAGFISGIDYMPTILEAAGLGQVAGMDGKSFVPLMKSDHPEPVEGWDKVFTQFHQTSGKRDYPMRCVQNSKYGYIYNAWSDGETKFKNEAQAGLSFNAMQEAAKTDPKIAERVAFFLHRVPEELYDLQADPSALKNLADDPAHKQTLDKMRSEMRAHLKSVGDPILSAFEDWVDLGKRSSASPETPAGKQQDDE